LIDELAGDDNVPVLPFHAILDSPDLPGRRLGGLAFRLP